MYSYTDYLHGNPHVKHLFFQMPILDGEKLKNDPVSVMDRVQAFLGLEPYFDYSQRLK